MNTTAINIPTPRPYTEMSELSVPWHKSFIGQYMQHSYWTYAIIDRVMMERPSLNSIIEIGTGAGALSAVFGLWGIRKGIPVVTIDRVMRHFPGLLERLGVDYWQSEEQSMETIEAIVKKTAGKPCWLFCDGGNKRREFREIGSLMPTGSIVSAHDLGVEFLHERDAADLCEQGVFAPYHPEWWMEGNVQLALYQRL